MGRVGDTVLATLLGGIFIAGPFTAQALPKLVPVGLVGAYAVPLLFCAAAIAGITIGMQSGSMHRGIVGGVASVVLAGAIAGMVQLLPTFSRYGGETALVSVAVGQKTLVLGFLLVPVVILGVFIGSALSSEG
ncbi:MAG: hypothetical protein ACM3ZU_12635 [Bacteroidota bacterium]